jgi:ABC-2 type transport system permease protein
VELMIMKPTLSITRKELDSYFSSLMALIFIGVFLAVTLFTFFWVDDFWARNLTDVRPLFRWMPLLMIFLVAALTMRQWSEEQQTGTLEILLTMPVRTVQLVLGKFLAVLALVAVALLLTIFLPITISSLGSLDWGPVIGGYLAALLMVSAYIAIGLFVSSRTDNPIVSLIVTVLVCGLFHMIGTPSITNLVGSNTADLLRDLSTSSRFESIQRGVIDMRDLLYYLSLTVAFLALNVLSLDARRWSRGAQTRTYRLNSRVTVTLAVVNLLVFNVLVSPVRAARVDMTADHLYSLSPVTKELLSNLQEPLLIRGYFSKKNHPLLEPLIPQIRDMLDEYKVAAGSKLKVETVDPIDDPSIEAEANQTYGIRPVPLRVTDRSGQSVINVYFDLLIRYGDQSQVLSFQDLIVAEEYGNTVELRLRNLEYDLTSAIKHVVFGFQSVDAVLASLKEPATLTLYYTPDTLPDSLKTAPDTIQKVAESIQTDANGAFTFNMVNVNDPQSPVSPQDLYNRYQIRPVSTSLFSPDTYYLHMVLQAGDHTQVIYPSGEVSESEVRTAIESGLKRAAPGFLKVVGLWEPPQIPQQDAFGQSQPSLQQYQTIQSMLGQNYEVRTVDLTTGQVPTDIDVLLVIAPQNMTDLERYAIDQYLMRGGSVFVAAGDFGLTQDPYTGSLALNPIQDGLQEMLASYGITVNPGLVFDPQNEPFPVPVTRTVSGVPVSEIQALNYPPFVDVRSDGMDRHSPIVSGLPAITMNWVSPITLDDTLNTGRQVTVLLRSTSGSWETTDPNIQPNPTAYPKYGFPVEGKAQSYTLAVAVEGSFQSFFKGKEIPTAPSDSTTQDQSSGSTTDQTPSNASTPASVGTLDQSPDTARLVVVGSAEFLNDNVLQISQSFNSDRYLNSLQFVQNAVDWFVQDTDLATIRSRGASVRVLNPLTDTQKSRWEILNYALALLSLGGIGVIWRLKKRAEKPMPLVLPGDEDASPQAEQPSMPS